VLALLHAQGRLAFDPALGLRTLALDVRSGDMRPLRARYLSGWLGGPPLYTDKYGHPMLRARHLPFAIGTLERDQWMACMVQAMEETDVPPDLRRALEAAFFKTADWMRNRPG